jgi:MFS family permease
MFLSGLYMPIDTVIFPTYFESIDNATGLGALFASLAAGMVIGSFAYGRLAAKFSTSTLLRMVMIVSTVSLFPLVVLPPTWLFVVLGFFAGLSWGPFNPLWNSIVQKRVQPELQGRVYGLQMSLLYAAPPLGQLIVGACVDAYGLQSTFVVLMAIFGVVGFTFAATPILRKL